MQLRQDGPHSCEHIKTLALPPSEIPPKTTTFPCKSTMPAPRLPSGSSWPVRKNWLAGASNLPLEAAMVGAKNKAKKSPRSIAWRFTVPLDRSITISPRFTTCHVLGYNPSTAAVCGCALCSRLRPVRDKDSFGVKGRKGILASFVLPEKRRLT